MYGNDNELYWVERHQRLRHNLSAVGDIASTEERNIALYAQKKRSVVDLLRAMGTLDLSNASILDAGCGTGMLAELFYALGGVVSGVDASPDAVDEARHRCPGGEFTAASLLDFRFERLFDFTLCIDVLYHIVDDENWQVVLSNLVSHTRRDGYLIFLDQYRDEPCSPASHVRFRTKTMYRELMSRMDVEECTPDNQWRFLVFRNLAARG